MKNYAWADRVVPHIIQDTIMVWDSAFKEYRPMRGKVVKVKGKHSAPSGVSWMEIEDDMYHVFYVDANGDARVIKDFVTRFSNCVLQVK